MPRCRGASGSDSTAVSPTLSKGFPLTVETQPELLAHHFAQAGLTERAIDYLRKAGQRSIERSANAEAIGHLTRALELLQSRPDNPQRKRAAFRVEVMLSQAMIASLWIRGAKAHGRLFFGRERSSTIRPIPYRNFLCYMGYGPPTTSQGNWQSSGTQLREFLAEAERANDVAVLCVAHRLVGTTHVHNGRICCGIAVTSS